MKSILQCSVRCVQGLLEGMGGNAFWDGLGQSLQKLAVPTATAGVAGAAAVTTAPLMLPMAAGAGLLVGSLVLSHRAATRDDKEKLRHKATMKILRKRTKVSLDRFSDLDLSIRLTNQNFLIRLNELEELIKARNDDKRLKSLLETNESLFIALEKAIFDNHTELTGLITDIDRDIDELGMELKDRLDAMDESQRQLFGVLRSIEQTGEDTNKTVHGIDAKTDEGNLMLRQILTELAVLRGEKRHVIQVLESTIAADAATTVGTADAAPREAVRSFVRALALQIADMESTENAMNERFIVIRATLQERFRLMGIDIPSMLNEIEGLRKIFRPAPDSPPPPTAERLKKLRRNLHIVASDMAQFPTDLLERAAKHGVYYYQFHAGLSEIGGLDRLLPDALAIADPDERWAAAAEVGLNPWHDDYGLENIARLLKTTKAILSLPPDTFSDGFAKHGWISPADWRPGARCVLAFGCYGQPAQARTATNPTLPGVLLLRCGDDCSIKPIGHLAARHVDLANISLQEGNACAFLMHARDIDYAYEWDGSAPTPARVWSPSANAPVLHLISYVRRGGRTVAVRRRRDLLLDDGSGTDVVKTKYGHAPRLIFDTKNDVLLEVDRHTDGLASRSSAPICYCVREPVSDVTKFYIRVVVGDEAHGRATEAFASLNAADRDPDTDAPTFVLSASTTLTQVDAWKVFTVGQSPLLLLRARSEFVSKDVPVSRWIFLIDISGPEPRLYSQPIRTTDRILLSTVVECTESTYAFCSLLDDRNLRRGVAGWKLNTHSEAWESYGYWHETDHSACDMEDALDIHATPRGNDADVFYAVRRHLGGDYRYSLYHFCSGSRGVRQLAELPKNFKEGISAILAIVPG